MKQKYKFPCGFEYEIEMKMGMFDNFKYSGFLDECPLHGKGCSKKIIKKPTQKRTKEKVK